jgi:hypothetical protein
MDVREVIGVLDKRRGGWSGTGAAAIWKPSQLMTAKMVARVLSGSEGTAERWLERACKEQPHVMDRIRGEGGQIFWAVRLSEVLAERPESVVEPYATVAYTGRRVELTCKRRANGPARQYGRWTCTVGTVVANATMGVGDAQVDSEEMSFDYG